MKELIGQTIDGFQILEQIGQGGMATVYKAYQASLDRYVAIKVLPEYFGQEPDFAQRFQREAKAVAKLEHPHILAVYDFGQEDKLSYIVMRYVDAGTLKDLMDQPLDLWRISDLISQITDALDYAHMQGIVHRDVKPSNVLLNRGEWVLLSDFGLAKMMEGSEKITQTGVGIGTPDYMSPEQGRGEKVDHRTDIYSLGVVLYEMLTGRVPYQAETPMAVMMKHINDPLPLPRDVNPEIPEVVEQVVLKALAKQPEHRYQSIGDLAKALREAVREAESIARHVVESGQVTTDLMEESIEPIFQRNIFRKLWWVFPAVIVLLIIWFIMRWYPLRVQVAGGRLEIVEALEPTDAALSIISTASPTGIPTPSPISVLVVTETDTPSIDSIIVAPIELISNTDCTTPPWQFTYRLTLRRTSPDAIYTSISSRGYYAINNMYDFGVSEERTLTPTIDNLQVGMPADSPIVWNRYVGNDGSETKVTYNCQTGEVLDVIWLPASHQPAKPEYSDYIEGEMLFEDSFEDKGLHEWNLTQVGWSVIETEQGNFILQGMGAQNPETWRTIEAGNNQWRNYAIESRIRIKEFNSSISESGFSIDVRNNPSIECSYYTWELNSSFLQILRADDCFFRQIRRMSGFELPIDKWFIIRLEITDEFIRGYVDGLQAIESDLAPVLGTPHERGGILLNIPPANVVWFDDFRVFELVPIEDSKPDPTQDTEG